MPLPHWLSTVRMEVGGPTLRISVGGKLLDFEMHPYCGPSLLGKNGEPLDRQPISFLRAASNWAEQGRRMEDGICRWDHDAEPITKHMGGRHYRVVGWSEPRRGE